jgi:hypothetical protein
MSEYWYDTPEKRRYWENRQEHAEETAADLYQVVEYVAEFQERGATEKKETMLKGVSMALDNQPEEVKEMLLECVNNAEEFNNE